MAVIISATIKYFRPFWSDSTAIRIASAEHMARERYKAKDKEEPGIAHKFWWA